MAERIYLRALEPEDYKVSILWRKDPEIWQMVCGPQYFVSEAYEKKWVENAIYDSSNLRLAICIKENNQYVGNICITDINQIYRRCTIHIMIGNKKYWGNGYAKEAVKELVEFMFNERGMNRIEARILEKHLASKKILSACGFTMEGKLRESVFKNGLFQNQLIYSILREDLTIYNK